MGRPAYPKISWNNTGKTSDPFKLDGNQIIGFFLPATIASTAITFKTTPSLATNPVVWYPVDDSGGSVISFTVNAATAAYYGFSADQQSKFLGVEVLQMNAGTSETAGQNIQLAIIPRQY